jgi:hypothetical protein
MADAPAFDWVCAELERRTSLDRLEARGTVRLALKQAGLDARTIAPEQMRVVLERLMPRELAVRGIEDGDAICSALTSGVAAVAATASAPESPEDVFRRLAGATAR